MKKVGIINILCVFFFLMVISPALVYLEKRKRFRISFVNEQIFFTYFMRN